MQIAQHLFQKGMPECLADWVVYLSVTALGILTVVLHFGKKNLDSELGAFKNDTLSI